MTTTSDQPRVRHPAASLPENERVEYLRIIASMALADGSSDKAELGKLKRLSSVLAVPQAAYATLVQSLKHQHLDAKITKESLLRFKNDPELRASLMMDSIVIAFSDQKLEEAESKQLGSLATALGFSGAEVVKIAGGVEKILFNRQDAERQELARGLGEELGVKTSRTDLFHWIKEIFSESTSP